MESMRRISYNSFNKSDSVVETCQNLTEGDLGFGLGLLPGAVVNPTRSGTTTSASNSQHKSRTSRRDSDNSQPGNRNKCFGEEGVFLRNNHTTSTSCLRCNGVGPCATAASAGDGDTDSVMMEGSCCGDAGLQHEHNYLLYGDHDWFGGSDLVPRQSSVLRRGLSLNRKKVNGDSKIDSCSSDEQTIVGSEFASQEVTELQSDLEAAKRQLNSKYRAIQILQSQAVMINKEHSKSIQEAKYVKTSLEQEVNCLQFDLSATQDCSMTSQRTWAERFDRVCSENRALESTLQEHMKQLRMAQLENLGLKRERDELLARLDVKERLQYNLNKSCNLYDTETHSMVEEHDELSSLVSMYYLNRDLTLKPQLNIGKVTELAVLGACSCRGSRPDPCGCARGAAGLKRDNYILKYEMDQLRQNLDATRLMADSFGTAFDHQLDQNILLCEKITSLCQDEGRGGGNKFSCFTVDPPGNQSNEHQESRVPNECVEDDQQSSNHKDGDGQRSVAVQASQPLPDLIRTLADLLNDKTEALVHQRLVAKMLARKTQDLEKTMQQLNEYSKG